MPVPSGTSPRSAASASGLGLPLLLWAVLSSASAQSVAPNLVVPKTPRVFGVMTPAPAKPASSSPDAQRPSADSPEVMLDSVVVDGAFEELHGALDTLLSQVKGRRISMVDVRKR